MQLTRTRALVAVCSVALSAFASPALAKPHHSHRAHFEGQGRVHASAHRHAGRRHVARGYAHAGRRYRVAQVNAEETSTPGQPLSGLFGGSSTVVSEARRYIGTNPTGRGSLWCGAFMDMVLKRTGHAGGGNLASSYAHYGTRVSGPQVGAIAVMGRRGGGHVGVVSGFDPAGNPIIISGNHNHRVAESVYPRGRIYAYVMPSA
jgi:uncharacterized protein (TIGR02594 family)